MAEKHAIAAMFRESRADAAVLLVTFALTLVYSLTSGISVGFVMSILLRRFRPTR
jgi:SulP family sulfate permease